MVILDSSSNNQCQLRRKYSDFCTAWLMLLQLPKLLKANCSRESMQNSSHCQRKSALKDCENFICTLAPSSMPILSHWFPRTYRDLQGEQLLAGSSNKNVTCATHSWCSDRAAAEQHKHSPPSCPGMNPCINPYKTGTYSSEEPVVVEP